MTSPLTYGFALLLAALLALTPAWPAFADEAPGPAPEPKPAPAAAPNPAPDAPPVHVKADATATATRIRISRQALAQLQGTAVPTAKKDTGFIHSPERTIGGGIALALAIVLAGLYLVRRNSRTALRPAVLIAAVALLGVSFAGSIALADRAPAPKAADAAAKSRANGQIATVKDGDSAELTISVGMLHLLARRNGIRTPQP